MGFVSTPTALKFSHPNGPDLIFVPADQNIPQTTSTKHTIILHEDVWINKFEAVYNRLQALTGKTQRIHGRSCIVKRINRTEAEAFLDYYHIVGYVNSYFKYGLFFRDELIAVGLFSKCRTFQTEEFVSYKSAELTRFACRSGIRVTGGLDKLINRFCIDYKVSHIMTYADKEWTDGKAYYTLGFEKVEDTSPLLFMVNKETLHRMKYEGHPIIDKQIWTIRKNLGNIKLVKIKKPRI
jgi:hypothetical protein